MMMNEMHEHTTHCWWNPDEARWVCAIPARSDAARSTAVAEPAESDDPELVDVRDMIVVHTAMLREFRLAPAAVRRTEPGDRKQAATVARHLRFVSALLHHHHEGEDALLWPKVRDRLPADAVGVIAEAEAQHGAIEAALTRVDELRDLWVELGQIEVREELAGALTTLYDVLSDHLDFEEQKLLPLAAATLTVAEWNAVGEAAVAAMSKPDLALSFGMFAYEGDPAVLRDMLKSAPPPVRVIMPRLAPRLYARRARAVHGTARP